MSRPAISKERLSDTLHIAECHRTADHPQGYWLYDETRGMNLAMGSPTKEHALLKALQYYQERLKTIETCYSSLQKKVDDFVSQFPKEDWER